MNELEDQDDDGSMDTMVVAGGPTGIGLQMAGVGFVPVLHMISADNARRVTNVNEARFMVCIDSEGTPFEADFETHTMYDITFH